MVDKAPHSPCPHFYFYYRKIERMAGNFRIFVMPLGLSWAVSLISLVFQLILLGFLGIKSHLLQIRINLTFPCSISFVHKLLAEPPAPACLGTKPHELFSLSWPTYLTSLCLSSVLCKMEVLIIIPTS